VDILFGLDLDFLKADSFLNSTSNASQQQPSQAPSAQSTGPVLPPPSGMRSTPRLRHDKSTCFQFTDHQTKIAPFFSPNQSSGHSLPALAGFTQATQASPNQTAQRPTSSNQDSAPGPQTHQGAMQGPGYSLPGLSQTLQQPQMHAQTQPNIDREREMREREMRERERENREMEAHAEEMAKRDAEQRERENRERQQHEQATHENHSGPIQIHQPVAVAPSVRTIHGPNGLLGNSGPLGGPNVLPASLGASSNLNNIFGGAPVQQGDATPRMQHSVQPLTQQSMLMPFGGPGMQPGPLGMGQGQQPILNVSLIDQPGSKIDPIQNHRAQ